jgi:predicted RNA-binding protein associated with RNAse of E/G family
VKRFKVVYEREVIIVCDAIVEAVDEDEVIQKLNEGDFTTENEDYHGIEMRLVDITQVS